LSAKQFANDGTAGTLIYTSQHSVSPLSFSSGEEPSVPVTIFSSQLSGLQALVRYLHERRGLSFAQIATLLNRSQKTIWTTYAAVKDETFFFVETGLEIPLASFAVRDLSVLETIVFYLSSLGFSNVEVARSLALDPRTTWTVKKRAEKKLQAEVRT